MKALTHLYKSFVSLFKSDLDGGLSVDLDRRLKEESNDAEYIFQNDDDDDDYNDYYDYDYDYDEEEPDLVMIYNECVKNNALNTEVLDKLKEILMILKSDEHISSIKKN